MKQGSTDDPFADEPTSSTETEGDSDAESTTESPASQRDRSRDSAEQEAEDTDETTGTASGATGSRVLPYIYKRDSVKDERSQRPVYLREYNEERIPDLVDDVAAELGADVTKTDVLEAAMETAIENPQQVADVLRTERYGYDWE
jgi:hypothetical protein